MGNIIIHLKQHTPMLHFQHNQDGATLRATEVKPKLDKFIISKLSKSNCKDKINRWLIGDGSNPALDYKMQISADPVPKEYLFASYISCRNLKPNPKGVRVIPQSPFFAQEQENDEIIQVTEETCNKIKENQEREFDIDKWDRISKKGLMWFNIQIRIFSFDDKLIDCIQEMISSFFICTNFGSRSNKGFGSFSVSAINNVKINLNDTEYEKILSDSYDFIYKKTIQHNNPLKIIFSTIKSDYQLIKSGTNFGIYKKSLLFYYADEKMVGSPRWEKRFFKQEMSPLLSLRSFSLLTTSHVTPPVNSGGDFLYIRALLGLAEQYDFLLKSNGRRAKEKAIVKVDCNHIERCQSPILFKVLNNNIYVVGNKDINSKMLKQEFKFTYYIDKTPLEDPMNQQLKNSLCTPDHFDLQKFMAYAMTSDNSHLEYTPIKM